MFESLFLTMISRLWVRVPAVSSILSQIILSTYCLLYLLIYYFIDTTITTSWQFHLTILTVLYDPTFEAINLPEITFQILSTRRRILAIHDLLDEESYNYEI